MPSDRQLLEEFADSRSEEAFRALVERHLDLVHSVARRVTHNDELARDVSQAVFLKLATRPESVPQGIRLLAWLHRTTRHKAIDLVRSENRRRRREAVASQQQDEVMDEPDMDWKELEPVIDAALSDLPAADRTLILARFYQRRSHAANARELGISEDAARMRTARALEKLRAVLGKRGITTTAALLGTAVTANAVATAPASLSATICSNALAAASSSAATATAATLLTFAKAHVATVAALAIAAPVIALQFSQNSKLRREVSALETQVAPRGDTQKNARAVSGLGSTKGVPTASARRPAAGDTLDEILARQDSLRRLLGLFDYVNQIDEAAIPEVLIKLRQSTPSWDPHGQIAAQLLLTRWGKIDPEGAFAYIDRLDYKRSSADAPVVLAALAAQDPQRAVEWLNDPDNKFAHLPWMRDVLAGTVTKEWARRDPDAALAWASNVPEGQRIGALTGVLGTLAASDPARASTLAMELEAGEARTDVIGQIAEAWAARAPQAAIEWASSLAGADRARSVSKALGGWASAAPAEAAAYIDGIPIDARAGNLIASVAENWARQAPADAAAWVAAQPEGADKTAALGHVMWNWTVADPQAASTWLSAQPPGPGRDNAIGGLAKATFDEDPAAAVTWAAAMTGERRRADALDRSVRAWLQRSPEAAREWLGSTDMITREEAQQFLQSPAINAK